MELPATDTLRALEALEARGARAFDAAGCNCVRALLTRAHALDTRAATLVVGRADVHLKRLEERFIKLREQSAERLARLEEEHGPLPSERAALANGELGTLRRRLRRIAVLPRGYRAPEQRERERARRSGEYEAAAADLITTFALARATDIVPKHAGPYNPLRIASDLLARMRVVSPIYLTAQLKRLDELSSMLALPELPETPQAAQPARSVARAATKAPARAKRGAARGARSTRGSSSPKRSPSSRKR